MFCSCNIPIAQNKLRNCRRKYDFHYVTGFRCSCGSCTEASWLKSRLCDMAINCWMNQCSHVELSTIVKIKIILITLIHINLKKIRGYLEDTKLILLQCKLKLLLIELCKDAKLEQSETMALPLIRVKRTDCLSTGLQHSLTIISKHFLFKLVQSW